VKRRSKKKNFVKRENTGKWSEENKLDIKISGYVHVSQLNKITPYIVGSPPLHIPVIKA